MAFHPLANSDHFLVLVSIDFLSNSKRDALLHGKTYSCSRADWDGLRDHLSDVPWEDILADFGKLLIVFLKKVNLLYLLYSVAQEVLLSASDKEKFLFKNFFMNSNLEDPGIPLPAFPSRTNLKLLNIEP